MTFLFKHYSSDRIIIALPDGVIVGNGYLCINNTAKVSLSCLQTNPQTIEVTITYLSEIYDNTLSFSISKITNNWFVDSRTFTLQTTTNDTSYFFVEKGSSVVSFQAAAIVASSISNN
jgi:hypothetical protein